MGDHRVIPNGEFIICETQFQTGEPCGNGGWINREEREISRHYRAEHGYRDRQPIPYHLCAIVSEAAVSGLVSARRLAMAKRKDGRAERHANAPRYPDWMPGGGDGAYRAALARGAADPVPPQDSATSDTSPDESASPAATAASVGYTGSAMDSFANGRFQSNVGSEDGPSAFTSDASTLDALLRDPGTNAFFQNRRVEPDEAARRPLNRPVQKFGDWDRDEDGNQHHPSEESSSDSEESADGESRNGPPPNRSGRFAIKTVPGYTPGAIPVKKSSAIGNVKTRIDVDDFTNVPHVRGFLTFPIFESVVHEQSEAINPFCLTPEAWDRGIRVVNAYFRTERTGIFETKYREFLLLFSQVKFDFINNHLATKKWFYEQRSQCENTIADEAAASGVQARPGSEHEEDGCSDDEQEAHRCYLCGQKLYSFRKMDVHFQVFHVEARRTEVSSAYRNLWQTKLRALGLELDQDDDENSLEVDLACHLCDVPFDDVDSIDRHFFLEHRKERKGMLLRLFGRKYQELKEAALDDLHHRYHAAASN